MVMRIYNPDSIPVPPPRPANVAFPHRRALPKGPPKPAPSKPLASTVIDVPLYWPLWYSMKLLDEIAELREVKIDDFEEDPFQERAAIIRAWCRRRERCHG